MAILSGRLSSLLSLTTTSIVLGFAGVPRRDHFPSSRFTPPPVFLVKIIFIVINAVVVVVVVAAATDRRGSFSNVAFDDTFPTFRVVWPTAGIFVRNAARLDSRNIAVHVRCTRPAASCSDNDSRAIIAVDVRTMRYSVL